MHRSVVRLDLIVLVIVQVSFVPHVTAQLTTRPTTAGVAERYSLYTPELQLLAETSLTEGTQSIAHEYIWFNGEPVAQIETATSAVHYYFNDHLGAPLLLPTMQALLTGVWNEDRMVRFR